VTEFADQPVRAALAAIAARDEAPAGGVASALTCAAAAALVELSAELAADRLAAGGGGEPRMRAHAARARELRGLLIATADDDLRAYAAVGAAEDARQRAQALALASDPPLAIAEWAAELSEAAAEIATAGDWAFSADAVAGGLLAAGAARAAEQLVAANLADSGADPRLARAGAAADRARRAATDHA
jgi:formiminotetrahydrofolate cyclodeaminase